ncbi:hypothetical protein N7373_24500 [Achromobacter mucicolens]|uniref:hypothetical protein n=1 Tax=Achromobacter mucicolens TaxID=1389922 RepID=UPI00244D4F91|nr:hypothetical protein [Achromobacter mucicolens]MDH0094622.1 hypothetical protein [Achromobacter mucicolens]
MEIVLKSPFLKRILKNCHSGLMRGLALRPGLRRTGFRRQQNNSGCVSKKLPGISWSVGKTQCKNLVVAAVWVYRGSVVEVVKGEPLQATRLERRSYCGSDRPARLKFLSSRVLREIARNTTQGVSKMLMQVWRKKPTLGELNVFDARNAGSGCPLWSPDPLLEPQDVAVHLRPPQQDSHHQPRKDG